MLRIIALILFFTSMPGYAAIDVYEFDTDSQRQRYLVLVEELRCPKCQNQNLAGSNSQISIDLRRELHRLLTEGKTDEEIKSFMVERYGEFVLYRPPLKSSTLLLWILPIALLIIGAIVIMLIVRQRKKAASEPSLSNDDQERLNTILKKDENP